MAEYFYFGPHFNGHFLPPVAAALSFAARHVYIAMPLAEMRRSMTGHFVRSYSSLKLYQSFMRFDAIISHDFFLLKH